MASYPNWDIDIEDLLTPEQLSATALWVFSVILPILTAFGLAGNCFNLAVLTLNDGSQKFKGTLFMYMKLLSCSEIVYACFAAQTCVFTGMGYMLTESPRETKSKALVTYLWIILYPTWHALGSVSDFIIVCMTVSRYLILHNIDKINLKQWMSQQSYAKTTVGVAALLAFSFYVPAYFQYEVVEVIPCKSDIMDNINGTNNALNFTDVVNSTCYKAQESCFTEKSTWFVYGWIFQVVVRFSPTVAIFGFNVAMVIKLRRVWNKRRELREKRDLREQRRRQRAEEHLHVIEEGKLTVPNYRSKSNTLEVPTVCGVVSRSSSTSGLGRSSVCWDDESTGGGRFDSREDSSIGLEMDKNGNTRSRIRRRRRKKLPALFSLPEKESMQELKTSTLLIVMALSHAFLSTLANVGYFFYIMAPDMYAGMPGAGIYLAVSEVLVGLKYCKNFYLYCLTNPDIRSAAADLVRKGFGGCCGRCKAN